MTQIQDLFSLPPGISSFVISMATTIQTLPAELLIEIFKSLDSVNDSNNLQQASKILHNVWSFNTRTICKTVLPRCIPSFYRVVTLSDIIINRLECYQSCRSVIDEHSLLLNNSRTAALQLDLFEEDRRRRPYWWFVDQTWWDADPGYKPPEILSPNERRRFRYFYYELWRLTLIPPAEAKKTIDAMCGYLKECFADFSLRWMDRWRITLPDEVLVPSYRWEEHLGYYKLCFAKDMREARSFHKFHGLGRVRRKLLLPRRGAVEALEAWND